MRALELANDFALRTDYLKTGFERLMVRWQGSWKAIPPRIEQEKIEKDYHNNFLHVQSNTTFHGII